MMLHDVYGVEIALTFGGKIVFEQIINDEDQKIYLTLDQFRLLQKWVDKNEKEILETWNDSIVKDEDFVSILGKNGDENED